MMNDDERPMVICAWCGTVKRDGSLPPSHGICDDCAREQFGSAFQRSAGAEQNEYTVITAQLALR